MPTYNNAKVGTRGASSYAVTGERPQAWREGILYLDFNGQVPMNALLSKMKGVQKTDQIFNWFSEAQINKGAALSGSGVYTDLGFGTALSADNTAAGTQLAARCTALFASYLRKNHIVLLRNSLTHSSDVQARVVQVVRGTDATSGFAFVTLKADTGTSGASMVNADRVIIIGSAHAEGASRPESISYVPNHHYNYMQIFRTALKLTRTAMKTKYRTEDAKMKAKKQVYKDHLTEMEDAFLWGERTQGTDDSGEYIYTTRGMVTWMTEDYPTNVLDYRTDSNYSGLSWDAGGYDFLMNAIEQSFRWTSTGEKLCYVGNGGLLAVQRIVANNAMYQLYGNETFFGIKVQRLVTPFGEWNIKTHPRFTHESSNTNSMLVFEPDQLEYNYIDDTHYMPDVLYGKGGGSGFDGINEEYLTECGLEFHHPEKSMYITNLGVTNVA